MSLTNISVGFGKDTLVILRANMKTAKAIIPIKINGVQELVKKRINTFPKIETHGEVILYFKRIVFLKILFQKI